MILIGQVLESILSRNLVLDCPNMTLVPVVEDGRPHYRGSGCLTFGDGGFDFKLFADQRYDPASIPLHPVAQSGQFLGDADYYTLQATDVGYQTWQSSEVYPEVKFGAGIIASGKVDWLRSIRSHNLSIKINVLQLWFPEKLRLPYDQVTRSVATVGEEPVGESWETNVSSFPSSGYNLTFRNDQGWTIIEASKPGELPRNLASCLQESLAFVLGRSIQATIIQEFDAGQITTTIVPSRIKFKSSHSYPPLAYLNPADAVWRLYERFFRYSAEKGGKARSHLSTTLQYIFNLFGSPLDALALALGVAVEGLLRTEFAGISKPSDYQLAELKTAEKILQDSELSRSTVDRILGSLANMRSSSAKDRLFALTQQGVISPAQLSAWKKLRNSTAHAERHDFDDAFLILCHKVLVLLYCLAFQVIGYEGPFTDYGAIGWPEKEYPFKEKAESPHNTDAPADQKSPLSGR
jgi:hypothetical protein